jgi:hypothetical protein
LQAWLKVLPLRYRPVDENASTLRLTAAPMNIGLQRSPSLMISKRQFVQYTSRQEGTR